MNQSQREGETKKTTKEEIERNPALSYSPIRQARP